MNNLNDEKWGISRILEALQANMWGNMEYTTSARPVGEAIPLIQTGEINVDLHFLSCILWIKKKK